MALYSLSQLPVPTGFVGATSDYINSNGVIAGACKVYLGRTSAMIWDAGGYLVIGPPGYFAHSAGINSNKILIGNFQDDQVKNIPFYWDGNTGTLTQLNIPI